MLLFSNVSIQENTFLQRNSRKTSAEITLDERLIERVGQGDTEAFAMLYHQTQHSVYAFVLSILRNREDAQDVMQDTYLKIRACAHLYHKKGKPLAWIFTIAKNFAKMKLRHRAMHPQADLEETDQITSHTHTTQTEDKIVLQAALDLLSMEERQIVILHAVSGLKHREIADLLEIPLATVLSKYRRSLAKLEKHLHSREEL